MIIKKIKLVDEIENPYIDDIDVFVENEDGYIYTIEISTPANFINQMDREQSNFISPTTPKIIVKELTEPIIKEAIESYAKDDGYWLKLCQFGDAIDISVLNKLEKKHRKILEEWEED